MERNFKLTLCYDGTRYRGWQRQGNTADTVQGKLEALLSRLLEQPVEVHGSGRTDAGVHAAAQAASFRADTDMDCAALLSEIRRYLPEDVGAVALEEAPPRFHARLSAKEKTYVYRVWNSETPCVFQRRYVYVYPGPLDTDAMGKAAAALCGKRDFAAFSTGKKKGKAATRDLKRVEIAREEEELRLTFTADGFLYNMARILAGTLLEVGAGQRPPEDMERILASGRREEAGFTAPAKGLCLTEVKY